MFLSRAFLALLLAAPFVSSLAAPAPVRARADELALWNDPGFQRRFAESYLAESDVEPKVTSHERDALQKVLELIAADKPADAITLIEKQRGPAASAVLDFMLANLHFQKDRLDPAAAAYKIAVEKYPKFRRAWKNLGLIEVRQERFADAMRSFTRVIELGGGDAITYGLLGFSCSNVEQHLAAESAYRMAALLDPEALDWQMGLARSFFKQKRYADAASLCGNLIERHPERADLWLLQANAWIGLQQPLRAAENYEIVERLGRSTAESLHMLGDIYLNEGMYDLATDAYVNALDRAPTASAARPLRAAKVLTGRGALAQTRRLVTSIVAVKGETLSVDEKKALLKLRARLAVAEGAGEEEVRVLEEIVALDPLDGDALLLLGQHRQRAGDAERAVFFYERAASLPAFEADAKVRHAQLLVGQGRYSEALPLLRRALVVKPRDAVQDYLEQVERAAQTRG